MRKNIGLKFDFVGAKIGYCYIIVKISRSGLVMKSSP